MHSMRKLISCLATRLSLLKSPIRRASGSNSFPELSIADDEEEFEPEHNNNILEPQYPILRSHNTDLFYMAQCVGPAYQGLISSADLPYTTSYCPSDVESHDNQDSLVAKPSDLWVLPCPKLLMKNMRHLFHHPYAHLHSCMNVSMVGMRFEEADVDRALRSFVLIASHEVCEIMDNGYWADFVNPLTGRAHFWPAQSTRKQCRDAQLLGHGMTLTKSNGCTVIEKAEGDQFTGYIFTDMPCKVLDTWFSSGIMDDFS
ncbi:uncharacterized protein [Drosophila kikkawai]|uniref:Methylmalonic aciduria and homocystinuria type D homolog, mitochondrial n=1 Tax=Drosophila kikkawai TaxID=30033 RepID=A0A6P4I9M0_DROKI|nr:uncharacterized protein LOC108077003 [Drosophila kikkawai]